MRVLVWNLFHGRADPPAGRPLLREFADALAGWEWDVALLQEVPPWWPPLLARRCAADSRTALTSRNHLLPLRRAIASRAPDRLKSNGGGANAILVRAPWSITAHGRRRLRIRPERRIVHAVRIAAPGPFDGAWIGNVHTQLGHWDDADGMAAPLSDLLRATTQLEAWAGGTALRVDRTAPGSGTRPDDSTAPPAEADEPEAADAADPTEAADPAQAATDRAALPALVLGGDFNLPRDTVAASLPHGWSRIASSGPDHVAGHGIRAVGPSRRLDRGTLSDHAPLLVEIAVR